MVLEFEDNDFIFSNAGWAVLAVNGGLSAMSSILILSIILRSSPESRFSTFHIIMLFMSVGDAMASIAMGLGTLPMPSDVHDLYPFAGRAVGNITSCDAQGFTIFMGTMAVLGSSITLNVYYVCTLRYGMAEQKFKKRILPMLLVSFTAISIVMPTIALQLNYFNPSPINYYCTYNAYPYGCTLESFDHHDSSTYDERYLGFGLGLGLKDKDANTDKNTAEDSMNFQCIRGKIFPSTFYRFRQLGYFLVGSAFVIMVLSLVLVVATVFDAELAIRRRRRERARRVQAQAQEMEMEMEMGDNTTSTERNISQSLSLSRSRPTAQEIEFKRTRAVLIQALMYIVAFVFTYMWTIIFFARMEIYSQQRRPSNVMAFLNVFFPPLQGFFNAIIFVHQKIHTLRQSSTELTFSDALIQVIISPSTVPQSLVSSIHIVEEDFRALRRQGGRDHHPISVTRSERHLIANTSGLRRFGHDNNGNNDIGDAVPPPASTESGVGSSFMMMMDISSNISLGLDDDIILHIEDDDHDHDRESTTSSTGEVRAVAVRHPSSHIDCSLQDLPSCFSIGNSIPSNVSMNSTTD